MFELNKSFFEENSKMQANGTVGELPHRRNGERKKTNIKKNISQKFNGKNCEKYLIRLKFCIEPDQYIKIINIYIRVTDNKCEYLFLTLFNIKS